jgi:hydroxymethylbilane synthase
VSTAPKHPDHLIIATRGSQLALWQANFVAQKLRDLGFSTELKIVSTTGDRVQDRFLHEIGGKGLFIRELEECMGRHEADLAVHSLKDLPVRLPEQFQLTAVLPRHSPGDVMVINPNGKLADAIGTPVLTASILAPRTGLHIATSSLRRAGLLRGANAGVTIEPIRGNVDTRIKKLLASSWDGIILAEAAFERLGLKDAPFVRLDRKWFVPSASQGALAIETLAHHPHANTIASLGCLNTTTATRLEREILRLLGGDCTMPFGAFAWCNGDVWYADATIIAASGQAARASRSWRSDQFTLSAAARDIVRDLEGNQGRAVMAALNLPWPEI